jgi:hypothetical protein
MSLPMTGRQSSPEIRVRAVLSQLAQLRSRFNRQLLEEVTFGTLALVIGAGALGVLAALWLNAPEFAALCVGLITLVVVGLGYAVFYSVRSWTSLNRAAVEADERVGLKNRLTTLLTARQAAHRSPLWPFLVEDTLEHRDLFLPTQVVPWRIPRALFFLLFSALLAVLAVLGVKREREQVRIALALKAPPTLPEMNMLPGTGMLSEGGKPLADGSVGQGTGNEMSVESGGEQVASGASENAPQQSASTAGRDSLWSRLSQRADQLAQSVQNDITGRQPQREARASDDAGAQDEPPKRQARASGQESQSDQTSDSRDSGSATSSDFAKAGTQNQAVEGDAKERQQKASAGTDATKSGPIASSGHQGLSANEMTYGQVGEGHSGERDRTGRPSAGAGHGAGSDPEHLYGKAQTFSSSRRTFKVTMQGNVSSSQAQGSGQPYRPPRADVALNPHQEPDQPMYRPQVAPADRAAIKRIFEP